jgi:hypothetical protein
MFMRRFLRTLMNPYYTDLCDLTALNVSEPGHVKGLAYTQIFKQDRH